MKRNALLIACLILSTLAHAERNPKAKAAFKYEHPCPSTQKTSGPCPGWVVDHIIPLACNGPDKPANMQWQTTAAAAEKDKWERKQCEIYSTQQ